MPWISSCIWKEASRGFCSLCLRSTDVIFTDPSVLGRAIRSPGGAPGSGQGTGEAAAPLCSLPGALCQQRSGQDGLPAGSGLARGKTLPVRSSLSPQRGIFFGAGRSRRPAKRAHLRAGGGVGDAQLGNSPPPNLFPSVRRPNNAIHRPGHSVRAGRGLAASPRPLLRQQRSLRVRGAARRKLTATAPGWGGGRHPAIILLRPPPEPTSRAGDGAGDTRAHAPRINLAQHAP